jgi:hypothetical protein
MAGVATCVVGGGTRGGEPLCGRGGEAGGVGVVLGVAKSRWQRRSSSTSLDEGTTR